MACMWLVEGIVMAFVILIVLVGILLELLDGGK